MTLHCTDASQGRLVFSSPTCLLSVWIPLITNLFTIGMDPSHHQPASYRYSHEAGYVIGAPPPRSSRHGEGSLCCSASSSTSLSFSFGSIFPLAMFTPLPSTTDLPSPPEPFYSRRSSLTPPSPIAPNPYLDLGRHLHHRRH
jgi:hypothetical protein